LFLFQTALSPCSFVAIGVGFTETEPTPMVAERKGLPLIAFESEAEGK
jgi:hypothetical protein